MNNTLLVGCSFTDPTWQSAIPWSVQYSSSGPCYISAKAGMGIKGICIEALYRLLELPGVKKIIAVLPNLWRMDIEMDTETYLYNAMVDLLKVDNTVWSIRSPASRKWIISGGLNYDRKTEQAKIFDLLYKHQGFLVLAKEHFRALQNLIDYCKINKIDLYISAIQDPMDQLNNLEYIKSDIKKLLDTVGYNNWFKFDGKFIDSFLGHRRHPTTEEHKILCEYIIRGINHGNYKTV